MHEEPRVPNYYDKAQEKWVLEPGVVIAIEPMITFGTHEVETLMISGRFVRSTKSLNAHFEHTIVITEKRPVGWLREDQVNKIFLPS